jgi:hypothetical protein
MPIRCQIETGMWKNYDVGEGPNVVMFAPGRLSFRMLGSSPGYIVQGFRGDLHSLRCSLLMVCLDLSQLSS